MEAHRSPLFRATWEATRSPLTIQAVSQLTGGRVGVDTLQHWVRGKRVPNLESAELLARVLGRPDLLSWLGEGVAEKIQEQDAGDAIVEHFQGLSRGQRQALLRRLEKPALERP